MYTMEKQATDHRWFPLILSTTIEYCLRSAYWKNRLITIENRRFTWGSFSDDTKNNNNIVWLWENIGFWASIDNGLTEPNTPINPVNHFHMMWQTVECESFPDLSRLRLVYWNYLVIRWITSSVLHFFLRSSIDVSIYEEAKSVEINRSDRIYSHV